MHSLLSWWSSLEVISVLSTVLKCTGAVVGIMILVVGFRESALRGRAQANEKAKAQARLTATEQELERTKAKTYELADRAAPRTITQQQREAFLRVAANQPKGLVVLNPLAGQTELTQYAHVIADMLNAAGYTTEGLIAAFAAAGIRMDKARNALQRDGVLAISIGTKP